LRSAPSYVSTCYPLRPMLRRSQQASVETANPPKSIVKAATDSGKYR
jgi:hypothetical protein